MKHKILMVYPKIPPTFWGLDAILPYFGKKSFLPPLGLLHVAAMLPENYEVKLVDMNTSELSIEDIKAADLVFLSAMSVQQESFNEVVKLCNECHTTVVAGGPHAWAWFDHIKGVDHIVLNESELTLPQFLHDYENGTLKKVYRSDTLPDITTVRPPRFDLINPDDYFNMPLQYSRGCPFNCEFCDIIEMYGRKARTKEVTQFLKELDALYETGYRGPVFIVDDNFVGKIPKTKAMLRALATWQKERQYPYALYTEASLNMALDDELMDLMTESGFINVFIGIETPIPETLNVINKKQNTIKDLIESITKIQKKGIMVAAGFIIGFDSDPENIFDLQIDFIQKAGIPIAMVGLLAAMPHTQLWRRLEKENRILGSGLHSGNNVDACLNFVPKMPARTIIDGYKRVISELYTPKNWFDRYLTLLNNFSVKAPVRKARAFPKHISPWKKLVLIKNYCIIFFKNLFSAYGLDYLKFIRKAVKINRINCLPFILLASTGPHYFCVAERIVNSDFDYQKYAHLSAKRGRFAKKNPYLLPSEAHTS